MPPTVRSLLTSRLPSGILTVLAIAVVGYVVRGALRPEPARAPALPAGVAVATGTPERFTLRAAGRNVVPDGAVTIATARERSVRVYARPKGKRSRRLPQRVFAGRRIPLTFLVRGRRKGWVHVDLPTRPNQSSGWVRRTAVDLSFTRLRVVVYPTAHRLRLLDRKEVLLDVPIAVGESLSPTPAGRYYVTDVIKAKDPRGFYGPYSLGLSAHSNVYTSFEGGDGQVGIHGTNAPAAIGSDVSHGCIRVRNDVVRRLAARLPLGTPVEIRGEGARPPALRTPAARARLARRARAALTRRARATQARAERTARRSPARRRPAAR